MSESNHIFLFPFTIKANCENKNFMGDIEKKLSDAGWENKPFSPKHSNIAYSEYFYFHPFARDAIFDSKESADAAVMKYFTQKLTSDKNTFKITVIKKWDKTRKETRDYELDIKNISLRIYETEIGILSFELNNTKYDNIDDIIKINDFGKRIYPQYLAIEDGKDQKDGIDPPGGPKSAFLADSIQLTINGKALTETFQKASQFRNNEVVIASYIIDLLGKDIFSTAQNEKDYTICPTIDDRMYVICWFGSDATSFALNQKNQGKYNYQNSANWYRYIFHDGSGLLCQHDGMLERLIETCTYERWANYGTFYGISRYGLVSITDASDFSKNVVKVHMQKQYAQMAALVLAQRASILRFSDKVSGISGEIKKLEIADKKHKKDLKSITDKVGRLHAAYIRFVNRMWFTEITPQEQGIEMYEKAVTNMRLKEDMSDLRNEIKELHEYTSNGLEKLTNSSMNTLTILGAIFLPLTLLTGIFGMNIELVEQGIIKYIPLDSFQISLKAIVLSDQFLKSAISLILFLLAVWVIFFMTRKYLNDIKDDDEIGSFLNVRYLIFPWLKR